MRLPTGDGWRWSFAIAGDARPNALFELSKGFQAHLEAQIAWAFSGPVSEVTDVNGRTNIAGAGINMAQRVMDCGDAGHILLSKHVADDLEQYPQWRAHLHDLGECEVKHGVRIGVVNLYRRGHRQSADAGEISAAKGDRN